MSSGFAVGGCLAPDYKSVALCVALRPIQQLEKVTKMLKLERMGFVLRKANLPTGVERLLHCRTLTVHVFSLNANDAKAYPPDCGHFASLIRSNLLNCY